MKTKNGIKFKCLFCGVEFEPTKFEWHLIKNYPKIHLDDCHNKINQPIPYCSSECFRLGNPFSCMPCHDELWYSNGEIKNNVDRTKLDVNGIKNLHIRPITKDEIDLLKKMEGREGFSYGSSVCILPSSRFYGKSKSPINWETITEIKSEDQND